MMDSEERPFSMHNPEERVCEFCTDIFYAHHGLQRYCPEKYGKKEYCKYEQKKLLNEKRLAERVTELAKAGMKVYQDTALDRNRRVLSEIMGSEWQKTVDSTLLDSMSYEITHFDTKTAINGTNKFLIHVGDYTLEWVGQEGTVLTFKITKK
jgi:hypothetical protein